MSDFRKLDEGVYASPQIGLSDIETAQAMGISLIINNRPDGESPDQPSSAEIEFAARAAGMDFCSIPITHAGFSEGQVSAMRTALDAREGPVLAYCRSGTRSTLLWALAEASKGRSPDELTEVAAQAGYDLAPVLAMMDMLAAGAR